MSKERLVGALRRHMDDAIDRKGAHAVVGEVKSIGPLKVHIPEHDFLLDDDDILIGQQVAQYDEDYGIKAGDSMVLVPAKNGDYMAVGVMTGTTPSQRKTGGGLNGTGGGPPAVGSGQDGDFAMDPATGAVYGPKAAGVWPTAPLPVGGGAGIRYVYSSDTAATDPTSGKVKFNSTTLASITAARISETDRDGNSLASWLATFDDSTTTAHRGTLIITKDGGSPTNILILDVVSALTDNGAWDSFTVAVLASAGSFADGDALRLLFLRTGDIGTTGPAGAAGAAGATGPTGPGGVHYVYSNDTALTDPTSGKIKFNSTTLASINSVRISETDADGNGLAALLATIDDSTTTAHRGVLMVFKDGAPASMLALDVTSALTDNGTWDNFTVAVLASNGSFTNGDNVHVHFFRTGDTGPSGGAPVDYVAITADVTVSGTSGAPTTVITGTNQAYAAGDYWVEFRSTEVLGGSADSVIIELWDGGTQLGRLGVVAEPAAQTGMPVHTRVKVTLTAATHQLIVKAWRVTTNGTIVAGSGAAGQADPAYLLVENYNNAGPQGTTGATGPAGQSGPPGGGIAIGALFDWPGPARSVPSLYLACFGQSVLRATYPDLFNALCPLVSNFTVTIAAPGVFTTPGAHGLVVGDAIFLTTTNSLPTNLTQNTIYYVMTVPSSTTFTVGTTRSVVTATGIATVSSQVTTTGSQSGTHTLYHAPHGVADGTHFNIPDFRGRIGVGQDDMGGSAASVLSWTKVPGLKAGEEAHLLTYQESGLPVHTHGIDVYNAGYVVGNAGVTGSGAAANWGGVGGINNAGGANAANSHNNVPPGVIVHKIIFAGPIDPTSAAIHPFLSMGA